MTVYPSPEVVLLDDAFCLTSWRLIELSSFALGDLQAKGDWGNVSDTEPLPHRHGGGSMVALMCGSLADNLPKLHNILVCPI